MEEPSQALKLFVYVAWIASNLSMMLALAVRSNQRLARRLEEIPLSAWGFATTVLAIGTYLLVLSQELSGIVKYDGSVPVIDSILVTIRMFGAQGGNSIQANTLAKYFTNKHLYHAYELTHSLARLAAPVDTLMGIYLLVSGVVSTPLLRILSHGRDTFVFSKLNQQTLPIASSIVEHYGGRHYEGESDRCLIAFAGVPKSTTRGSGGTGRDMELIEGALSRQMLCLSQSFSAFIGCLKKAQRRKVFVISDTDEMANLQNGLSFVKQLAHSEANRPNQGWFDRTWVYVISAAVNADIFVDEMSAIAAAQVPSGKIAPVSVRRIDKLRNTIEAYLWKYPLFLVEKPNAAHAPTANDLLYTKTRRRIAIIGQGALGYELLKAAIWCSQIDGIDFTLDFIGPGDTKDRLAMDCPEVVRLNGSDPESVYHINFYSFSVEKADYLNYLRENRDELTYLVVALGDDLQNSKVARRTREILEQGRYDANKAPDRVERPLICAVIGDKSLARVVSTLTTAKGAPYDILPIGVDIETHSYDNLFTPALDLLGLNVNRAYWGCYDLQDQSSEQARTLRSQADANYDLYEYNRRSSRATALHLKYKLFAFLRRQAISGLTGTEVPRVSTALWEGRLEELVSLDQNPDINRLSDQFQAFIDNASEEELRWLSVMEHNRWNAYVRTEGYELADEYTFRSFYADTNENQNRLSRQHVCLVPFDDLPATSDFVYPVTQRESDRDYLRLDEVIVHHLKQIVEDHELS